MSDDELTQATALYVAGIEAELVVLRRLQRLSERQRTATQHQDMEELRRVADERAETMASFVALEQELKPVRHTLTLTQDVAKRLGCFDDLVALHKAAARLVTAILSADHDTVHALREAELARRTAGQAGEGGPSTLDPYRRVVAPLVKRATFVNHRG
jgi:hypothetical protein